MELPYEHAVCMNTTGDGFKSVLRYLLTERDLCITRKPFLEAEPERYGPAQVALLHRLHEAPEDYDRVILDVPPTRHGTKTFLQLQKVVRGKPLIYTGGLVGSYWQALSVLFRTPLFEVKRVEIPHEQIHDLYMSRTTTD